MSNTVAELLEKVDYSNDPSYVPSAFAIKVVNFIKLMTDGEGESSPTPIMHYKILDSLQHASTELKFQRIATLAARGSSKTSILSEILFFYIAVFGVIDNFGGVDAIIYISDTMENGVRSLKKNMEARYNKSEFLQKYLPIKGCTFNQGEIYLTNIDGRKTGIRMFGAGSKIRGVKIFGKRPQLAVIDDILSDVNAKSDNILETINALLYKGIDQALDPIKRKIIFAGTPFAESDPLYTAIESGVWESTVFPICEKFPCTKEEFKGSWEERFTYEHIRGQYEALKAVHQLPAFYQELMLEINSGDTKLIYEGDINWFSRSDVFMHKERYYFYITTDFATTASKSSDFSGISVWAINHTGHMFWVDGVLAQQTMDKNINDLFTMVRKYSPRSVGIEINGQQAGFIPWIKQRMVQEDVFFSLAKSLGSDGTVSSRVGILASNKMSKLDRLNLLIPDIKSGKLYLPTDMAETSIIKEALRELNGVTSHGIVSRRDDWLDTLSMLGQMHIIRPAQNDEDGTVSKAVRAAASTDQVFSEFWGSSDSKSAGSSTGYYV